MLRFEKTDVGKGARKRCKDAHEVARRATKIRKLRPLHLLAALVNQARWRGCRRCYARLGVRKENL